MLKRNIAVVVLAGLVLGAAAVAWAGGEPARPTLVAAQTGETPTTGPPPTPEERQARREAARQCLEQAGEDAAARRACLDAAGIHKPDGHHGRKGPGGPGPGGPGPGGPGPGVLGRAVHGTVVVPAEGGGWQEVTFDRGTVDAASDESKIVLDRPDGQEVTIALTADTRYRGIDSAAALQDGRPALVVSKDGKATQVVQRPAE